MRCPFLALATHSDIWLDPWAKWVLYVLNSYRKLAREDRQLAEKIFSQARKYQSRDADTLNGAPVIMAHLLRELRWDFSDKPFQFSRPDDVDFCLLFGSQRFFHFWIGKVTNYSWSRPRDMIICGVFEIESWISPWPASCDNSLSNYDISDTVSSKLQALPITLSHARCILKFLFTGSMYDYPRKYKVGLATNPSYMHCGETDTHLHIFKLCPYIDPPCVPDHVPTTTWITGIMFEDSSSLQRRKLESHQFKDDFPSYRFVLHHNQDVFIDGSYFYSKCRRSARAIIEIFFPEADQFSFPVIGSDHSLQRAKLHALATSLKIFVGPMTIFSDNFTAVKGFDFSLASGYNLNILKGWNNYDLWEEIHLAAVRRLGDIYHMLLKLQLMVIIFVKTHIYHMVMKLQIDWLTNLHAFFFRNV